MKVTEAAPRPAAPPRLLPVLFAAPGVIFILLTATVLIGPLLGFDPIWRSEALTLPEAAGLRDDGEVLRLLREGADVNAAGPIRPDFIKSYEITMTPLEAAVGIRRADMVKLLLDRGATLDGSNLPRLVCFARQERATDVEALLLERGPAGAAPASCDGIKTPW